MSFKQKNRKKITFDTRVTLDAKHNDKINIFSENKQQIQILKNDIINLKKKNKILLSKSNKELDKNLLEKKLDLMDQIKELEEKVKKINSNKEEVNYLLNTGHLLYQYYDTMNHETRNSRPSNINKSSNKKSVMEFFQKPSSENKKEDIINTKTENEPYNKNKKLSSRANIYDAYLYQTEENYVQNNENIDVNICKKCSVERIIYLSEGFMVCPKCGEQDYILIDSDKPSYKDPPREVSYFAYKRINHFNEWLAQFQAKESTDIPQDVYDQILVELKKERIENMVDLSPVKLREILKKLKKNKYYEHVPHIINRLNGVPPPIMSPEKEEELRRMFKEIQIPFHKFCPKQRKNFLSYSYVLHKFVQLLELDEFLPCFMLLKSREKLHQQDLIWKKICEYLKWEFIPSL
jgi:hypothetical protein